MNWKKLLSIGALTMFSASIATGQGTAPTIVQGDYISNVFGNSNFIKNPNAKLNNASVTVSSATVTRSTATPLVATSEFLVTTSTSTGYADWSTRTFDAGMKGQNCEARFSYRGFSVGSTTAQILQGANVVAQLTLTASTDPRIASINFPCGDLSTATTFRLQQATASLTGTNEIGGIYVGLATNMANVAQAEFVGSLSYQAGGSCQWSRVGDGTFANFAADSDCVVQQTTGVCNDSAGKIPGMTCNLTKPGRYEVIVQQRSRMNGRSDMTTLFRIHDGTTGGPTSLMYQIPNITSYESIQTQTLTASYEYTSAGTKTFQVQSNTGVTNTALIYGNETTPVWEMKVYRFPSSSELVVTPERQNVWGSAYYSGNLGPVWARYGQPASTTFETLSSATFAAGRTVKGKCQPALTGNDLGCSIPDMPVGNYRISVQGLLYNNASSASSYVDCTHRIYETQTATQVTGGYSSRYNTSAGVSFQSRTLEGVFTNASVGTRNFVLQVAKPGDSSAGNISECGAYVNTPATGSDLTFTIQPLDQPSNSALYVQGPVLGAQTGAAIPAGYVGEMKQSTVSFTNIGLTTYTNLNTVTLTRGVWSCSSQARIARNGATVPTSFEYVSCVGNSTSGNCDLGYAIQTIGNSYQTGISNTFNYLQVGSQPIVVRYDGSNFIFSDGTISASATGNISQKIYLDASAGTPQALGRLECVRIN